MPAKDQRPTISASSQPMRETAPACKPLGQVYIPLNLLAFKAVWHHLQAIGWNTPVAGRRYDR